MSVAGAPAPSTTFVASTAPAMGWGSIFHPRAPSFSAASLRRAVGGVADRNTTLHVVSVHPPGPPMPQCSQVESVVPTSLGWYTSWASEGSAPPVNSKTLKTRPPGSPPAGIALPWGAARKNQPAIKRTQGSDGCDLHTLPSWLSLEQLRPQTRLDRVLAPYLCATARGRGRPPQSDHGAPRALVHHRHHGPLRRSVPRRKG